MPEPTNALIGYRGAVTPRVLHLSTTGATGGGAGRAAQALHEAMVSEGINSIFMTAHGVKHALAQRADRMLWRSQRSPVATWRSPARFGSLSAEEINRTDADVVNLHWVTNGFLSVQQIGRITKPIVWSLYDMWAFCGTEHYGVDSADARWRTGYTKNNRPITESGWDIDRNAWERKLQMWHPTQVVPASGWLEGAVRDSALMGTWPVTRIPHVIDTEAFAPLAQDQARSNLGINHQGPIILFLSSAGTGDHRKGFDLLEQALAGAGTIPADLHLLVVGPRDEARTHAGGVPIIWFGSATTNEQLRNLYCAANVTAVPSREDNMPLTAMEAQACGRPVVAFSTGGLPDIISHGRTGFLADPFDIGSLANGLIDALTNSAPTWGATARERALQQWSSTVIVKQYLDLYERALS